MGSEDAVHGATSELVSSHRSSADADEPLLGLAHPRRVPVGRTPNQAAEEVALVLSRIRPARAPQPPERIRVDGSMPLPAPFSTWNGCRRWPSSSHLVGISSRA